MSRPGTVFACAASGCASASSRNTAEGRSAAWLFIARNGVEKRSRFSPRAGAPAIRSVLAAGAGPSLSVRGIRPQRARAGSRARQLEAAPVLLAQPLVGRGAVRRAHRAGVPLQALARAQR